MPSRLVRPGLTGILKNYPLAIWHQLDDDRV